MMKDTDMLQKIYDSIQDFREEVRCQYVTKEEFLPVKTIVFGMVGIILTSIVVAILASVIKAVF